jgi:hypothetical protein
MVDRQANRKYHFRQLKEPQSRGDATEAIIRAEFAVRGLTVLCPEHDNAPYDFVVEIEDEFYRMQAKTAYDGENNGAVRFEARSTRVKNHGYERESYTGKIEYFAVYNPINEDVYLVSIHEATTSSMTIRYKPPANGNWKNINWHENYRLDTVLSEL